MGLGIMPRRKSDRSDSGRWDERQKVEGADQVNWEWQPRENERDMCMDPGAEDGDDVSRWLGEREGPGEVFDIELERQGKSGLAKGKMITSAGCRVRE
jgi:hypothetical protein